jgi:hypothetical protein
VENIFFHVIYIMYCLSSVVIVLCDVQFII